VKAPFHGKAPQTKKVLRIKDTSQKSHNKGPGTRKSKQRQRSFRMRLHFQHSAKTNKELRTHRSVLANISFQEAQGKSLFISLSLFNILKSNRRKS
jgi:hypothetical protein